MRSRTTTTTAPRSATPARNTSFPSPVTTPAAVSSAKTSTAAALAATTACGTRHSFTPEGYGRRATVRAGRRSPRGGGPLSHALCFDDDRRPGRGVDVEPEDVRPVVVADGIEQAARGHHPSQVEVGDERLLPLAYGTGEDVAAG